MAVFLTGGRPEGALGIFLGGSAVAMLALSPDHRPPRTLGVLFVIACLGAALAFLPAHGGPAWRSALAATGVVPIAESVTLMPSLTGFWFATAAATCLIAIFLSGFTPGPRELGWLALVIGGVTALYATLALASRMTGWMPFFHGGGTFGFFPNRNHTATLLVTGSLVSLSLAFHDLRRNRFIRGLPAAVFCIVPLLALLLYSESRAGVLLLIPGMGIWLLGLGNAAFNRPAWIATGALALLAGVIFFSQANPVKDRLAMMSPLVAEQHEGEITGDYRLLVYADSLKLAREFPLTGVGLGMFQYVFPQYQDASLSASLALHPESDWLMLLSETGWIPLLALLAALLWWVRAVWRARQNVEWTVRWGLASATLTGALHGLIDVPWHRVPLGWWLLTIALCALPQPTSSERPRLAGRLAFAACGLAIALFSGTLIRAQWIGGEKTPPFRVDFYERQLAQLTRSQEFDNAETLALDYIKSYPMRREAYYWMGGVLLNFLETDEESSGYFRASRLLDPGWPTSVMDEARLWSQANTERAAEAWCTAIDRAIAAAAKSPRNALLPSQVLGQALDQAERLPDLQAKLLDHVTTDPRLSTIWLLRAEPSLAKANLSRFPSPTDFFNSVPQDLREPALRRWASLGHANDVRSYLTSLPPDESKTSWKILAEIALANGDAHEAVTLAASHLQIPLTSRWKTQGTDPSSLSPLEQELATLWKQRNDVAVRRLIAEATNGKRTPQDAATAAAFHAEAGDWPSAWTALLNSQKQLP